MAHNPQQPNGAPIIRLLRVAAIAAALTTAFPAVADEYRLHAGDVLEISVVGMPELRQRIPVELDGRAQFPLVGEVRTAGMTLSDLRSELRRRIPQQVYRAKGASGFVDHIISGEEISVTLSEYRPVYLTGDVSKPGEVAYRPNLTIRQALAIAGGLDVLRSGGAGSLVETLTLQSQLDTLGIDFAKERARAWRAETALGRKAAINRNEFPNIRPEVLSRILELQAEHLKAQQSDHQKQKVFFASSSKQANDRAGVLTAQSKEEEEGAKLDAADSERVDALFRKGLLPATRVSEVRRAALLASSRALQTRVAAEAAKKEREEAASKLERLEDTYRIELLRELEEANARQESLLGQIQATREKLALAGAARTSLGRGPNSNLQFMVHRKGETDRVGRIVTADSELLPGDVVDVTLTIGATGTQGAVQGSTSLR